MRAACLILSLLCAAALPAPAQPPDLAHRPFPIGQIYYFGYGGIDLPRLEAQLPLHTGDTFTFDTFDRGPIEATITRLTGHPPTDIGEVCCEHSGRVTFYIGLAGTTSRPLPTNPSPTGSDHLAPEAISLYDHFMAALAAAVAAGQGGEDDSRGYMLADDPATHALTLKMRSYALNREPELVRVLQHAADPKQRQVAAELLGYVQRSPAQIPALEAAILDPDGETRNNALRALEVLLSAQGGVPANVDPTPLIALLYSGKWTDRNKASLLLARLADPSQAALLDALRRLALPALAEGASWDDGHASAFVFLLARVLSIPSAQVKARVAAGTCCNATSP